MEADAVTAYYFVYSSTAGVPLMNLGDFRVVIADWATPPDVIVIEHVTDSGACLVAASALPFTLQELVHAATRHYGSSDCRRQQP